MDSALLLAAIGLLASKMFELLKRIKAKDVNGATSIVAVWVAGFVVIALASHAVVSQGLTIPGSGLPLGMLDWLSQLLLGMTLSSFGSFAKDFKSALDGNDSAVQPPLLGPPQP